VGQGHYSTLSEFSLAKRVAATTGVNCTFRCAGGVTAQMKRDGTLKFGCHDPSMRAAIRMSIRTSITIRTCLGDALILFRRYGARAANRLLGCLTSNITRR
jgi:hypothetical protein